MAVYSGMYPVGALDWDNPDLNAPAITAPPSVSIKKGIDQRIKGGMSLKQAIEGFAASANMDSKEVTEIYNNEGIIKENIIDFKIQKDLQKIRRYQTEPIDPELDKEFREIVGELSKQGKQAQEISAALGLDYNDQEIVDQVQEIINKIN